MLFPTIQFASFFLLFFVLYWAIPRRHLRWRSWLLLAGSYWFYGSWDWRFLGLLLLSSSVDFLVGLQLSRNSSQSVRKRWLWLSIGVNLGILGFFKYFDFFVQSFVSWWNLPGPGTLGIILPVGISFYTFQTLSYSLDVYRGQQAPAKDALHFFTYVAFFPQLVAGPIERADHLLPQLQDLPPFRYQQGLVGIRLLLHGLFLKLVIADPLGRVADQVFAAEDGTLGLWGTVGVLAFAGQIYGDFAGYSRMAIGLAKLLGVDLRENFRRPYFSTSLQEFWQRWHISLSTWFRDYVYIPLGGNRGGSWFRDRNILITFLLSGLWHGAGWQFVFWGGWHGVGFVVERRWGFSGKKAGYAGWLLTMLWVLVGWTFFRAPSFSAALHLLGSFADLQIPFPWPQVPVEGWLWILLAFPWWIWLEFSEEGRGSIATWLEGSPSVIRYVWYYGTIALIFLLGLREEPEAFIYFQF